MRWLAGWRCFQRGPCVLLSEAWRCSIYIMKHQYRLYIEPFRPVKQERRINRRLGHVTSDGVEQWWWWRYLLRTFVCISRMEPRIFFPLSGCKRDYHIKPSDFRLQRPALTTCNDGPRGMIFRTYPSTSPPQLRVGWSDSRKTLMAPNVMAEPFLRPGETSECQV